MHVFRFRYGQDNELLTPLLDLNVVLSCENSLFDSKKAAVISDSFSIISSLNEEYVVYKPLLFLVLKNQGNVFA